MEKLQTPNFRGYVTLLCMDKVNKPLWVDVVGRNVCIVDDGYMWLQQFPQDAFHAVTTMFDAKGEVVEWYIDVCKHNGLNEQGVLFYDDLYLDVIVSPDGRMELLDALELDDALQAGLVSSLEYNLAWREADSIMTALEADLFPLLWLSEEHKDRLLQLL